MADERRGARNLGWGIQGRIAELAMAGEATRIREREGGKRWPCLVRGHVLPHPVRRNHQPRVVGRQLHLPHLSNLPPPPPPPPVTMSVPVRGDEPRLALRNTVRPIPQTTAPCCFSFHPMRVGVLQCWLPAPPSPTPFRFHPKDKNMRATGAGSGSTFGLAVM